MRNNRLKRVTILGIATAVLLSMTSSVSALPITRAPKARDVTGRFKVVGTQIIGPDGNVFIPRGVNKGGLEWLKKGYEEGFWNYQRMKSWGANVVRVPISPAFGLSRMCTYDKNYMARVDKIVAWGEQLRMLVILDNHVSTKGVTCGVGKWAGPQKAPDIHSLDFAKLLAKRYKNRAWVAIDLYNEPHDIPDSIWRNGGNVDGWRAVGMQQLVDAVRSTGNSNLIFATGNLWGNDLRMVVDNPLLGKNIVYAAHSYPFWCDRVVYFHEPYSCRGKQYPPHLDGQIAPAIGKRAVMLSEFGTQRSIPGEMQAPIDWAERHGIGWAAWLWGNGKMTDFCLLDEAGGNKPSISGKPVHDALKRFAA